MSVTIVSEPHEEGMHPTLPQLVKAASIIGQSCTVIMPGGNGADEASKIQGVEKVIKLNGACFSESVTVFARFIDIKVVVSVLDHGDLKA